MEYNIKDKKLQHLVIALEKRYGSLYENRGCNINRKWFSPQDILNMIREIDEKNDIEEE